MRRSSKTPESPSVTATANVVPEGATISHRPWDNPYAVSQGIPWEERRYLFDWSMGYVTVAPAGDGLASNGGWHIEAKTHPTTGAQEIVRAAIVAPKGAKADDVYDAQNQEGMPYLTYAQADRVYEISENEAIPLRDAVFRVIDIGGIDENRQLRLAASREVYGRARPKSERAGVDMDAARARLARLTGKKG